MVALSQVKKTASEFVRRAGRPVMMAWGLSVLFDLAMIRMIGVNILAMLDITNSESLADLLMDSTLSGELVLLASIGLLASSSFRKGLWYPAQRQLEGERLSTFDVVFSAAIKVIPAIAAHQVIALAMLLVNLLCMALGLSLSIFPQIIAFFALSPAIFLIVTGKNGFVSAFGTAIHWTTRHGVLLFAAQAVGLIASQILGTLLSAAWVPQAGLAVAVGSASLYVAVSWLSWVAESAAYMTVARVEL